ncbi:MAG: hypothetical protein AAGC66_01015 [Leifsonia sp.]
MNASDAGGLVAGWSGARIHPHWLPRVAVLLPTGVLSAASVVAWKTHPTEAGFAVTVVWVALCVAVAVRWMLFAGVRRRGDHVIVTGLLWSRSIPLRRIDRVVDGYSSIRWRTRSGMRVITPVTTLWSNPNPLPDVSRYNGDQLRLVRAWVREARDSGTT